MRRKLARSRGLSLLELMVALSIVSVGMLGFVGAFQYLSESISNSRSRTIATSLAQQQQEYLKTLSYFLLVVTTAPVYSTESGVATFPYDSTYYPSQTTVVGGNVFTVRTYVQKVQEVGGNFSAVDPLLPDTGMKQITVYVMWQPGGAGNYWMSQVTSLSSNPNRQALSSTITGNVSKSGGSPNLQNVRVECLQDASLWGLTDTSGNFNFNVGAGSYTLRASLYGYYTGYSSTFFLAANSTSSAQNIQLTQISTGNADGFVWISTSLVISEVVASSTSPGGLHQEWVELFNPTTSVFTIETGGVPNYNLLYGTALNTYTLSLNYVNATVAPNHYYLIADTNTITVSGVTRTADAYYAHNPAACSGWPGPQTCIQAALAGGVGIQDSGGHWIDSIGWGGVLAPSSFVETAASASTLNAGDQFVRMSSTGTSTSGFAPSYQTDKNSINFLYYALAMHLPEHSSADSAVRIAGVPAVGAIVTTDDGLSSPTTAQQKLAGVYPYAEFDLLNIGTGTYTLAISSGVFYQEISSVTINAGATTYVPNASTTPTQPSTSAPYNVFLDSQSSNGYVTGYVWNATGSPLSNITVQAGGVSGTTASDGSYILSVAAGLYTVTANPASASNYNSNYISLDSTSVNVVIGQLTTDVDYYLSQGGDLTGWMTTNGTDPLPNITVLAVDTNGNTQGSSLSGSNGHFTIINLSTGTYYIEPQLDVGESVNPSSPSATVSLGATTFTSSFTVSGAFGTIQGTLFNNSQAIQTGVLLMATTGTIVGNPPSDTSSFRSGGTLYYAASSISNGSYQLPVRGSASPGTTYNVYAWYTKWNGSTPSTSVKTSTTAVTEGGSVTLNFNWP